MRPLVVLYRIDQQLCPWPCCFLAASIPPIPSLHRQPVLSINNRDLHHHSPCRNIQRASMTLPPTQVCRSCAVSRPVDCDNRPDQEPPADTTSMQPISMANAAVPVSARRPAQAQIWSPLFAAVKHPKERVALPWRLFLATFWPPPHEANAGHNVQHEQKSWNLISQVGSVRIF